MKCPLCGKESRKNFSIRTQEAQAGRKMFLWECPGCGVLFAEDYKEDRSGVYGSDYGAWGEEGPKKEAEISEAKKRAFRRQLSEVLRFVDPKGKKFLDVGTGPGYLLECARELGFECEGTEISQDSARTVEKKFHGKIRVGKLEKIRYPEGHFDVVALTDVLEHLSDPCGIMAEIRRILSPGGLIFIISPNSNSLTRKIFRRSWFQYKYEHIFYFNRKSLEYLLRRHGFSILDFKNNVKEFSISYYSHYLKKYNFSGVKGLFGIIYPILPKKIKSVCFPVPVTGEFIAIAKKNDGTR